MGRWTTDAIDPRERLAYWREVVCETVLSVGTEAHSEQFWARIDGRSAAGVRFASFDASSHEIVRERQHLSAAPADTYLVSLQRQGCCYISQNGEDISLSPNEIALIDGQKPFRVVFPADVSRILAVIPKSTLDGLAPALRGTSAIKIDARSPFAALTSHHMLELADRSHNLSEIETGVLTGNLFNLLALSVGRVSPVHAMRPELRLAEILLFCREQLGNPDLSAQSVAERFGISVRTLQLWFRATGTTFGRWLLDARLDAVRGALQDPNRRALNISETAYGHGFNDLSHFNKAFRARFGHTPGECRNGVTA